MQQKSGWAGVGPRARKLVSTEALHPPTSHTRGGWALSGTPKALRLRSTFTSVGRPSPKTLRLAPRGSPLSSTSQLGDVVRGSGMLSGPALGDATGRGLQVHLILLQGP